MAKTTYLKAIAASNTLVIRTLLSGLALPPSLEISTDASGCISFKLVDTENEFGGSLSNFETRRFGSIIDGLFTGNPGDSVVHRLLNLGDPVALYPAVLTVMKSKLGFCVIGIQESTPGSNVQKFNITAKEWYSYAVLLKAVADIDIMNMK